MENSGIQTNQNAEFLITKSYDELNLVDWPLLLASNDEIEKYEESSLRQYTMVMKARNSRAIRKGYLKIYTSSILGSSFLKPHDEDVLYALIGLAAKTFFQSRKMRFTNANEILMALGWSRGGKNYTKLQGSITRIAGITLETDLFYEKERNLYETRVFHLIDRVSMNQHFLEDGKERKKNAVEIEWSETFHKSLHSGYVRPFDYAFWSKLPSAGTKRLFRILDKRLYNKSTAEIPLSHLGLNMMGYHPSNSLRFIEGEVQKFAKKLVDLEFIESFAFDSNGPSGTRRFTARKKSNRESFVSMLKKIVGNMTTE